MNRPPAEMVPSSAFPPAIPSTDHSTAVFVVFETVAVRLVAVPSSTDVLPAVTLTPMGGFPDCAEAFAPVMPPQPAAASAARPAAKSSDAVSEKLRRGGRGAANTTAFDSKASASDAKAQPHFPVSSRDSVRHHLSNVTAQCRAT